MSGGANPADFIGVEGNPGDCHSGSDCARWTYRTGGGWGGVMYWPFGCTWETLASHACGINVLSEGGVSAVYRLSFWARGEHGGERIEFTIGSDPGGIPPTPKRSLGTVTLGSTWQRYQINLSGVDLSDAISLFYWGASDENNPGGAVFYLDDIQFEGVR
jgi:hypothetical protein